MLWQKPTALRRSQWLILTAIALLFIIPFLFYTSASFARLHSWLTYKTNAKDGVAEEPPHPGFYDWDTRSAFNPVRLDDVAGKSVDKLCAAFPTHLLEDIQPIIKTGHGVLEARVGPQLRSVSACLTNLLIFSDVDEVFEGHDIIDVVADNPERLVQSSVELEAYRNGSLVLSNSLQKHGWRTDRFKFLPAVSRAWRMRPQRRWYVLYEADTYIVWDNVFRLLENFDPDKPHYFGSPSPGVEGTWMANGGPGMILSREAVRRLTKNDWDPKTGEYLGSKLAEKYWDEVSGNCCGDSSLGWALWNAKVPLEGLWPMFNPHPPHAVPFSNLYWCQPVLTMHKPLEEDIISLWRWQWEHREIMRPLMYRDLATSYLNISSLTTRDDWNNAAWDDFGPPMQSPFYSHDPHASTEACASACAAHEDCFQWTYHLRKCQFVRSFRLGRRQEPELPPRRKAGGNTPAEQWDPIDQKYIAGWDAAKIQKWMDARPCEKVEWVRPSTERIF